MIITEDPRFRVDGEYMNLCFVEGWNAPEHLELKKRYTTTILVRGGMATDIFCRGTNVLLMLPDEEKNVALPVDRPRPFYKSASQNIWDRHPDAIAANYARTTDERGQEPLKEPHVSRPGLHVWTSSSIDRLLRDMSPLEWIGYKVDTWPNAHVGGDLSIPLPYVNPDPRTRRGPVPHDAVRCSRCQKVLQCTGCGLYQKPTQPLPAEIRRPTYSYGAPSPPEYNSDAQKEVSP